MVANSQQSNKNLFTKYPTNSLELIPTTIRVNYKDDLDLFYIHEYIMSMFATKRSKVPSLESSVRILNLQLASNKHAMTRNEISTIQTKIKDVENDILEYSSDDKWNEYITEAIPLLESYSEVSSNEAKGILDINTIGKVSAESTYELNEDPELIEDRVRRIQKYLNHCRKFITIDDYRSKAILSRCNVCDRPYSPSNIAEDMGKYTCPCGNSHFFMVRDTMFGDGTKYNGNVNSYEERSNFARAIERFCAKQSHTKIPSKLLDMLDDYFMSNNMQPGSYYRSLPVEYAPHPEMIGNKHDTNPSMLVTALKETKNSIYYDDIVLIGHLYWGWIPPDLSSLEKIVMEVYDATKMIFNNMQDKLRQSSLNVNLTIYDIFEFLEIPKTAEDFKLLDSKESRELHKEMWNTMTNNPYVKELKKRHLMRMDKKNGKNYEDRNNINFTNLDLSSVRGNTKT